MTWLPEVFGTSKPILGMVHLPALPGSPLYDERAGMAKILASASHDLEGLVSGGVDGVIFCNENDRPYQRAMGPEVAAAVSRVINETARGLSIPFGVDLLWDPVSSIAVAHATGAAFVREIFSGAYTGDLGVWGAEPDRTLRYRRAIGATDVRLLFNIAPEFSVPIAARPIGVVARTTVFGALADALCVSAHIAGAEVSTDALREAKSALPDTPVFANTGVRIENFRAMLEHADGAVVGSSFKRDGHVLNPVDAQRVTEFMTAVRAWRGPGAKS